MGIQERRAHYAWIERERGTHVIAIYLGIRQGLQAQMSPDMYPALFRLVLGLPEDEKPVDIIIDSFGGQADVAIRINDMLREAKRDVSVLVPRYAFSAATMLALGAAKIVMHPFACLGPIDPQLMLKRSDGSMEIVAAEDIKAFVDFIREDVGITDQTDVAEAFARMYDDVKPWQLGVARRASMRSISIAKELLERHAEDADARMKINPIAERLAGGYHAHGHPIPPTAALALGLPVEVAPKDLAAKMWELIEDADGVLGNHEPVSPHAKVFDAWNERLAKWIPEFSAAVPADQPKPVGEMNALKLSSDAPVIVRTTATMGLVEGMLGAYACEAELRYIGSVNGEGVQVSGCPPVTIWKDVH